jgi:hypothetical protein
VKVREESRQESRNGRGTDELIGRVTSICCTAKTTKVNNDDALGQPRSQSGPWKKWVSQRIIRAQVKRAKGTVKLSAFEYAGLKVRKVSLYDLANFTAQMHADRPRSLHASLILARIP